MNCIVWDAEELKELKDKGHTIATLTTAINRFKELYGKDAIPSTDWLSRNAELKNSAARKESGFGSASKVSFQGLKMLRARIGRRNNELLAKGINRQYRCPDTYLYGDTYKVELVQKLVPINPDAKMKRLAENANKDDALGKFNTPAITDLQEAVALSTKIYDASPAKKNIRFNASRNVDMDFQVNINDPNFDTVSGRVLENTPDFDLPIQTGKYTTYPEELNDLFAEPILKEPVYAAERIPEDTYEQLSTEPTSKTAAAVIRQSQDKRFFELAKNMQAKATYHYNKLQSATTKLKNYNEGKIKLSEAELEQVKKTINKEKHEIRKVENKRLDIINFKALEDVEQIAEQQLKEMDDMLKQKKVSLAELSYMYDLADTWIKAGDNNIFFTQEEQEVLPENLESLEPIRANFAKWATAAKDIKIRLNAIAYKELTRLVQEEFGKNVTKINVKLESGIKDIDYISKMTIDLSEFGDDVLTLLNKLNKSANYAANVGAKAVVAEIHDKVKAANKILKKYAKSGSHYDILMQTQSNTDSRYTGRLVEMSTEKYQEEARQHSYNDRSFFGQVRAAFKWMSKNEMIFDARILFADNVSEAKKQAHIKELKAQLGEIKFAKLYEEAKRKEANYQEDIKIERKVAEDMYDNNAALVEEHMQMYEDMNSPYKIAEYLSTGYKFNRKYSGNPSLDNVVRVPLKEINGKDTGYYDDKYDIIYAPENAPLRELYEYAMDKMAELKQLIPNYNTDLREENVLPQAQANIIEMFAKGGIKNKGILKGLVAMWETVKSSLSTTQEEIDDKEKKTLQTKLNNNDKMKIKKYVNLQAMQYKRDNKGKQPPKELIDEWTRTFTNEIVGYRSFDLSKNLKAFALNCMSYYHKKQIEGIIQLAQKYTEANDKKNIKQLMNHFAETFYGYPTKKKELKFGKKEERIDPKTGKPKLNKDGTKVKVYSHKFKAYNQIEKILLKKILDEKEKNKKELADLTISKEIYDAREDVLNKWLDESGSVPTVSQHADQLLKFIQLIGMSWNVTSGISNFLFGGIVNFIEAGDGRLFNQRQLSKAMIMVYIESGLLSNATVGFMKTPHAQKIRNIMEKLDVLKEMKYELKDPNDKTFSKKAIGRLDILTPYKIQSATEYLNQAPIMIACLMNIKINNKAGETKNLWEALDKKGNLKEDFKTPENIKNYEGDFMNKEDNKELKRVKARVDAAIKVIQGNYDPDSPLLFKIFWVGRALMQFRRWMPQSFRERFGKLHYNQVLGMEREGRYRKGMPIIGAATSEGLKLGLSALVGFSPLTLALSSLSAITGTITYAKVQDEARNRADSGFHFMGKQYFGVLAQTLFQTEYLIKKLTFNVAFKNLSHEKFGFSEVDAANLKKNLNELIILTLIHVLKGLHRLSKDDPDDDKGDYEFFFNLALNQLNRMEMDMELYTSPTQFMNIASGRIAPVLKIASGFFELGEILAEYNEEDKYGRPKRILQSGPNKGRNKLEVFAQKWMPLLTQIDKTKKLGAEEITGNSYKQK